MSAAKGVEKSQETSLVGHGIFTFGLLQAIRKPTQLSGNGELTLAAAFDFAQKEVAVLRDTREGPQTPELIAPPVLRNMTLVRVATHRTN